MIKDIYIYKTGATLKIKPLSVNECWQGKRYKTPAYKIYERDMLLLLPKIKMPAPPYEIYFAFGFSNAGADVDNPVKPLLDILQKKYGFNDNQVNRIIIEKTKVVKGEEYLHFNIFTYSTEPKA